MTADFMKEHTDTMRCIRRGKFHAVYLNRENGLYEIWDRIEQCNWTDYREEAIEIMKFLDRLYLEE